jgi:hypothetical protein
MVLHHLNQQSEPHDPFDAFSGTSGLTAATEQIWLLTRKRGDADAYLMIDGKDIEEPQELALGWDAVTCSWTAQGDAQTYRLNKERREIVELLEREDEPMGPKEVADTLGKDYSATRQMMSRMNKDGQLNQEGYGKYVPSGGPSHSSHSSHTSTNGSGVTGVTPVDPSIVAGLFANPPEWLTTQLDQYHKDPARYLRPLCAAVATEVLLDATLWEEVRDEVERVLEETEG